MKIEVDQSGRIDDTSHPTILAFSDGKQYTVYISAVVKRACIYKLRRRGFSGSTYYIRLFTVGLYFLLRKHITNITQLIIDIEYFGKDNLIRRYLLGLFQTDGLNIDSEMIQFGNIGKKSPAHVLALETYRGEKKPDKKLTEFDLMTVFDKQKSRGPRRSGENLLQSSGKG